MHRAYPALPTSLHIGSFPLCSSSEPSAAQALHTEHSSSHTPGLLPGRFSCLWMASLQSWKHYLDFKTLYRVKDIFLTPRNCIIFPWISEQSHLFPVWNVMWGSVTAVKIQH